MVNTRPAKRTVIVADAVLRDQILEILTELGATSYHLIPCSGRGHHPVTGDLYTHEEMVRIESVTLPDVGEAILKRLHNAQFRQYALSAYADDIQVAVTDQSLLPPG